MPRRSFETPSSLPTSPIGWLGWSGGYWDMLQDPPQFPNGGPEISVKHTFLDFVDDNDDPLAPPTLARASTVPSPSADYEDFFADEDLQTDSGGKGTDAGGGLSGDSPVPEAIPLARCITKDWYEDPNQWSWADAPVEPTPAAAVAPPTPNTSQDLGNMNSMSMQPQMMAQPMMYQVPMGGAPMLGMPVMMMQPVMIPVMPGGYEPPAAAAPVAECSPGSGSSPGRSPGASPNAWPPPPPELAPSIERVSSGAGQAPQFSPQMGTGQSPSDRADLLASYADDDNTTKSDAAAASSSAPAAASAPVLAVPAAPQPQTLMRSFSLSTCNVRIQWHVDARKLRGNDKQAVSPPFELSFGNQLVTFKMMLYPKVVSDAKGGASFKKAKGTGFVQLKCEAELSEDVAQVKFRIGIGNGSLAERRGPISHNFSQSAVCGLPKDQEEFDFPSVIDADSMTFLIVLEIVPAAS